MMKRLLPLIVGMLPLVGVGQTWYWVPCSEQPYQSWGCFSGGSAADINPVTDPQLFATNLLDSTNAWVYGVSSKSFLGGGSEEGWITDTVAAYDTSLYSQLVVAQPVSEGGYTWIKFEHRYNTDSLLDGGYVEFSCDSVIWNPIDPNANYGIPEQVSLMNYSQGQLANSYVGFSGSNNEWTTTVIYFVWYTPVMQGEENRGNSGCGWGGSDELYFRFNFISDNIDTPKGGWMIRNITIGSHDVIGGIEETSYQPLDIYPNPATTTIRIQLPEGVQKASSTTIYDMQGRLVHQQPFITTMDVSTLSRGTYAIVVQAEEGNYRGMIQKE